jgi:hypothetical protein
MAASLTLTPEQVLGLPEGLQRKVVEVVEALSAAERKEEGDGGA